MLVTINQRDYSSQFFSAHHKYEIIIIIIYLAFKFIYLYLKYKLDSYIFFFKCTYTLILFLSRFIYILTSQIFSTIFNSFLSRNRRSKIRNGNMYIVQARVKNFIGFLHLGKNLSYIQAHVL